MVWLPSEYPDKYAVNEIDDEKDFDRRGSVKIKNAEQQNEQRERIWNKMFKVGMNQRGSNDSKQPGNSAGQDSENRQINLRSPLEELNNPNQDHKTSAVKKRR